MTLSYSDVAEIVKIVDSSNCDEVSLELEGAKILIRRKLKQSPQVGPMSRQGLSLAQTSPPLRQQLAAERGRTNDRCRMQIRNNRTAEPVTKRYLNSMPSARTGGSVPMGAVSVLPGLMPILMNGCGLHQDRR